MMQQQWHVLWLISVYVLVAACDEKGTEASQGGGPYTPDWDSLDKRPLPQWYDDAKVGIFLHWGVFSVPSFQSEWFWWYWKTKQTQVPEYMKDFYPPNFAYADFAREFRAEFFSPDQWADLFHDSGAKYVVLTAKHHEGFCNWPSATSWQWNALDVGPRRDLVGLLANAIRKRTDLRFGLYHSLFEWFNPFFLQDQKNNFTTQNFVKNKMWPELIDLVETYKPQVIWSDGDGDAKDSYWDSTKFLAWLYNESPVKNDVVVNDRWGRGLNCKHGDFYTCRDRYHPGALVKHKWENCFTLDRVSWGFRREARLADFLSIEDLIYELVSSVAFGGNILINIGPTAWGTISPIYEERLRQMGAWLKVNGEAIYGTRAWKVQTENNLIWYTCKYDPDHPSCSSSQPPESMSQSMVPNIVYAILPRLVNGKKTQEARCTSDILLPSVKALPATSEFYLLDGIHQPGIKLAYEPSPQGARGVTLFIPKNISQSSETFQWGCAIKMINVDS